MGIKILPVGQLSTNCYLFYNQQSQEAIIIDPGEDGDYIIRKIQDLDLKPKLILASHGHFDHVLAITELKLAFNIPFYLHKKDLKLLKRAKQTASWFIGHEIDPVVLPDQYLKDQQILKLGDLSLKVIETPGHTAGSISLYSKDNKLIFVGDLIFKGGSYGRTDLEGGNEPKLFRSIKKVLSLPSDTIIYPGHGGFTIVGEERKHYPNLLK